MSAATGATGAMKAVTLRLDDEVFAIAAESVREILDLVPITRVPNAPPFVGGLINVRGSVVPLADFRVMFGFARRPPDHDTRIVVIEIDLDGEPAVAGILADKVHDVTDIAIDSVEPVPRVGLRWPAEFIRGIGKRDDTFIIIPDVGKIFETLGGRGAAAKASEEGFPS